MLKYQIRSADPTTEDKTFDKPEDAASYWNTLNDPLSRLFVIEDGKLHFGTHAQVKPVYDALASIRQAQAALPS